jgi:hypothetical protein
MTQPAMVVEEFKAAERNTLRGWARVRMPSGMVLHDVGIFYDRDSDRAWVSAPSKAIVGRDGVQMRSAKDSKPLYTPAVSFETKALYQKFSDAAIAALRLAYPQALPPRINGDGK